MMKCAWFNRLFDRLADNKVSRFSLGILTSFIDEFVVQIVLY
jgi:hypothetical protein